MEPEKKPILIIDGRVVRYKSFSVAPAMPLFRPPQAGTKTIKRATHFEIEITCRNGEELHLVRYELENSVRPRTDRRVYSFS